MSEEDDGGKGLLNFLSIAEGLRKRAENHTVRGQKEPLLDPSRTWKSPPDLALSSVEFGIPGPTDWAKEQLSSYRAKK
jgi:hypothetical protein